MRLSIVHLQFSQWLTRSRALFLFIFFLFALCLIFFLFQTDFASVCSAWQFVVCTKCCCCCSCISSFSFRSFCCCCFFSSFTFCVCVLLHLLPTPFSNVVSRAYISYCHISRSREESFHIKFRARTVINVKCTKFECLLMVCAECRNMLWTHYLLLLLYRYRSISFLLSAEIDSAPLSAPRSVALFSFMLCVCVCVLRSSAIVIVVFVRFKFLFS